MKGKKKKEEDISSETRKKKPAGSGRLSSMIESMQKRGSPVSAHKVATKYFDSFRRERNIPPGGEKDNLAGSDGTAVDTGVDNAVITAVDSAVKRKPHNKLSSKDPVKKSLGIEDMDTMLSPSESRVYWAMHNECTNRKSDSLRFGLKELRELTGLSDKTVRVSIHSLEDKRCIKIIESSQGIYGRKFRVLTPGEVLEEQARAGIEIDPTTRKVIKPATPMATAVNTAVSSAVATAVHAGGSRASDKRKKVMSLYKRYTGNQWTDRDDIFYKRTAGIDIEAIETAIIMSVLKGKGGMGSISAIESVLREMSSAVPEGYLEQLREVWRNAESSK